MSAGWFDDEDDPYFRDVVEGWTDDEDPAPVREVVDRYGRVVVVREGACSTAGLAALRYAVVPVVVEDDPEPPPAP